MKKSEVYFSIMQVLLDWFAIMSAAVIAFWLRDHPYIQAKIQKDQIYELGFDQYMTIAMIMSVIVIIIYALDGLYKVRVTRRLFSESAYVAKGTTIAIVFIMIGFFLQREWFSSRFIIVAAWILAIILVLLGRLMTRTFQKYLVKHKGVGRHRVLLVGSGGKLRHICRVIQRKPSLGYHVVNHIDHINIKRIKKIRNRFGVDEMIVNESEMPDELVKKLYDYCQINDITYKVIPSSNQTVRFEMRIFAGEPVIEYKHTSLDGWGAISKRIFDIIFSSILIVITAPIVVAAMIAIKIEDPKGPLIFKNKRIGANGEEFDLYKLRYLKWKWCTTKENPDWKEAMEYERELIESQSDREGPIYKIIDDPRRMRAGRILERLSIDEFPQFFNVLKGQMSLVGPRPHQEREVENYRAYHRRLLTVKPGITGMAQVMGRSDLDFEDEFRLDVYYIENWTLLLDIIIILKTVPAMIRSRENAQSKHVAESFSEHE